MEHRTSPSPLPPALPSKAELLPLLCLFFLTVAAWKKIARVEEFFGGFTRCYGCFIRPVLEHDSLIFGLVIGLYLSSRLSGRALYQCALKFAAAAIFVLYAFDVFLILTFDTRLYFSDLEKYAAEGEAISSILRSYISTPLDAIPEFLSLAACVLVFALIFKREQPLRSKAAFTLFALPCLLLAAFINRDEQFYVHSNAYLNFFEVNQNQGWKVPYSEVFRRVMTEGREEVAEAVTGDAERPNVVFVVIESLSAYHSRKMSGLDDATPLLDELADSYLSYSQFYANGFDTQGGLYAFLTGRIPFPDQAYSTNGNKTIPRLLEARGYQTHFLTTGDLEFQGKGDWLKEIGFDYIEGHDHPFYDGMKRYHFEAAPDAALYDRVLEKLSELEADSRQMPYFLFLETVSTHHPFQNPETERFDEHETFRYADRQVKIFYDALEKRGFFSNGGLLIITSDHRSMVPVKPEQVERYGLGAASRIPLIVIGEKFRGAGSVDEGYQQADFLSTFASYTGEKFCPSAWRGVMWGKNARPASCTFHSRGDNRSAVDVFCGSSEAQLELRGDNPRWLKQSDGDVVSAKKTAERIHYERLSGVIYSDCD